MAIRRRILPVALVSALLVGFAWLVLRPHEVCFEGKPVSRILLEVYFNGGYWYGRQPGPANSASRFQAERAVRALGTNLLPLLIRWAGTHDSGFREVVGNMAWDDSFDYLHLPPQAGKHEVAAWAFGLLGDQARPAVPALVQLLQDREAAVRASAAECLGAIGPAAAPAVPALVRLLESRPGPVRYRNVYYGADAGEQDAVAHALGAIGPAASAAIPHLVGRTNEVARLALMRIREESLRAFFERLRDTSDTEAWSRAAHEISRLGTNADPAIPLLVAGLQHTNSPIQEAAFEALRRLRRRPDLCVPAFAALLESPNPDGRINALEALAAFGPAAAPALPAVTARLRDDDYWVRRQATNALRAIDPAASRARTR